MNNFNRKIGKTTIVIVLFVFLILFMRFRLDSISDDVTIITAVLGVFAIWYQLKREQDISRAEFIVTLNNTFNDNGDISQIYKKLKLSRDSSENVEMTSEDGRTMGDYIMFFQIINYLLDEKIIKLEMINHIFSNKFFIFTNNTDVQKYQLRYNQINSQIFELYIKWYNFRVKRKDPILYSNNQFHLEMPEYFIEKNGKLELNMSISVGYDN